MPRYYFHLVSPDLVLDDNEGVQLPGLDAAHWHGVKLAYQMRVHAPPCDDGRWVIKVTDGSGAEPLVILPHSARLLKLPAG